MAIGWRNIVRWACTTTLVLPIATWADDNSALDLQVASGEPSQRASDRALRLFGELALGHIWRRGGSGPEDARRASLDVNWVVRPGPQWRLGFSDRLDDLHPVEQGERSTLNSLREAYVGWQSENGQTLVDFGRVNLRNGPAYGFNPTDFFRDGSSRAVTTADPLALRENRLGTVLVRLQQLGAGGSITLALAPKVQSAASDKPFSADLGATNHSDRALLVVGARASENVNAQLFAFHERGKGAQLGLNATAVVGNATVAFVEWEGGRDADLLSEAIEGPRAIVSRQRMAAGATYTTESRLSVTMELGYNGFAASKDDVRAAVAKGGVDALNAYLYNVQRRQDIAARRALTAYASQRNAFVKNLDLTALLRMNLDDRSRFAWAELRYRLPKFDLALQWQTNIGTGTSEFGSITARTIVGVLGAFYF